MRRLTLALLLPLAACTAGRDDPRGVDREETLVRTTGIGRAEARPDEARFSAGVSAIGTTGPEATAANARKMNAVIAVVRALGVAEKDIQTQQLSVARLDYGPNRNRFEANNVVAVRIRAVDKAGEVIAAATQAGANILSGPELRVGDPEAATRKAYADAYRAARARADTYATAAGLKVARVLAIRDTASGGEPVAMQSMAMERDAAQTVQAAPPVMRGTTEATVAVTVDFALGK